MKKTTFQLIVLVLAGLAVAWREWTSLNLVGEGAITSNWNHFQETGSPSEGIAIIYLGLVGGVLFFAADCVIKTLQKLSSPNSV